MRIAGFLKVRNEILREGNLYRVLAQLDQLCDGGVICDDASSDGTAEHLRRWVAERPTWVLLEVPRAEQDFHQELRWKQRMLDQIHQQVQQGASYDWILWMDADEVLDCTPEAFRAWAEGAATTMPIWCFHYTQFWRGTEWARIDGGMDEGWYWKLWRYSPELHIRVEDRLHQWQFPINFADQVHTPKRAPFEVLHYGNAGQCLKWKAIQYAHDPRSVERHLTFGQEVQLRPAVAQHLPEVMSCPHPRPFSEQDVARIVAMKGLQQTDGLFVVIVPAYNRGYLLDRTVRSVMAQTDPAWVLFILDDGSTDDTPEVARRLVEEDARVFYARYPDNRGGVAMNEVGMGLACDFGWAWVRLGSDDYFEPHKLALDRLALTHHKVCYGPYRDLHADVRLGPELRNPPSDVRGALLSGGFAGGWANIAVRCDVLRQVRERHGGFCDPRIRNMEDFLVNIRLARLTDFVWRGQLRDGQVIVGGRSYTQIGIREDDVAHDGVWRIAADGASAKPDIARADVILTQQCNQADTAAFGPVPRDGEDVAIRRYAQLPPAPPIVPVPPRASAPGTPVKPPSSTHKPPSSTHKPAAPSPAAVDELARARSHWVIAAGFPADKETVYPRHAAAHHFDEQRGKRVLEYGCGGGSDTLSLCRRGAEVWYADIVPGNVETTTRRLATRSGYRAHPLVLTHSVPIPLDDASMDTVTSHGVLHHVRDPLPVLREFHRVLRPGGKAYIMLYTEFLEQHLKPQIEQAMQEHGISREEAFGWATDTRGCPWAVSYTVEQAQALAKATGFTTIDWCEYGAGGQHAAFRTYQWEKA